MIQECSIGIDLGGTNLRMGIVDAKGCIVQRRSASTVEARDPQKVVSQIAGELMALSSSKNDQHLCVGCGIPGLVDGERGVVMSSPHFPQWQDVPIREMLSSASGHEVIIDNDANMHALGEARSGAGRGRENFILLTLGTGIGGGIIIGGKIFHGESGFAGEVGHIVVEPEGEACGCGGRGCLERYAASHAFPHQNPEAAAALALSGDAKARELWQGFGKYLGAGIATLCNAFGIFTFVIGGGITKSRDLFIARAREEALSHTYACHASRLQIISAALGEDAGVIGAASAAQRMKSFRRPESDS